MSSKILVFAGSARAASFNVKLAKACARLIDDEAAEANFIDLNDYQLPIYHGDLESESGIPENVYKLRELFSEHEGMLIASPEYNNSVSPLLKNVIDWVSRDGGKDVAFKGKVAAVVSTSPGRLGGLRGLSHIRAILSGVGVHVIPQQYALPNSKEAFDKEGNLVPGPHVDQLKTLVKALVETTNKLHS